MPLHKRGTKRNRFLRTSCDRGRGSVGMQDPSPQQIDVCSTIHLTLEKFQAVNLAFHLPAAPRRLESRPHRR